MVKKAAKGAPGSKRLCLQKRLLLHRFGGVDMHTCHPTESARQKINTREPVHEH